MSYNPEVAEKHLYDSRAYIKQQLENAVYLNSNNTNPCLVEKQLGNSLTPEQFGAKLKKLNPSLKIETHPTNPSKICIYYNNGTTREYITVCENILIPEHSIMCVKEEEVPDTDIMRKRTIGGVTVNHIDKRDLVSQNNGCAPGFKKVKIPWSEARRGWRTVLCKIIDHGYVTPTDVEIVFGSDNTPQWKRQMGKGNPTELW